MRRQTKNADALNYGFGSEAGGAECSDTVSVVFDFMPSNIFSCGPVVST